MNTTDILEEKDEQLVAAVCRRFGVSPEQIVGDRRFPALVRPRHVLAALLRRRGYSFPLIASILGYRDHTSAMSACSRVDASSDMTTAVVEILTADDAQHASAQLGMLQVCLTAEQSKQVFACAALTGKTTDDLVAQAVGLLVERYRKAGA